MRDIGYSLSTALADLIDNCIAARSRTIQVFVDTNPSDARVGILDDGWGMTEEELLDAMRLGSKSPLEHRDESDLGRFGLGLKTASFSQCRVLTVVSRAGGETAIARWNLDHIAISDRWYVEIPDDPTSIPWIEHLGESGTLVIWENLDMGSDDDGSGRNAEEFIRQMNEARSHLELVFHRFLAGDPHNQRIRILLNNRVLEPFDPFHSRHPATIPGPLERIRVSDADVDVRPFTLPHHGNVTQTEWEHYAGPEGYLKNQGFYVYRERRLIIHGTWFGLARQTELTKLARIQVDMPNSLDGVWRIDIKKASAQLPPVVRSRLRRIVEPLQTSSKRVFRSRGRRLIEENRIPVWNRVQSRNQVSYRLNEDHPMVLELMDRLTPSDCGDLRRILDTAGASLPLDALFADLGDDGGSIVNTKISDETLRHAVLTTLSHLMKTMHEREKVLEMMSAAEPFSSNWARTVKIIETKYSGNHSDE